VERRWHQPAWYLSFSYRFSPLEGQIYRAAKLPAKPLALPVVVYFIRCERVNVHTFLSLISRSSGLATLTANSSRRFPAARQSFLSVAGKTSARAFSAHAQCNASNAPKPSPYISAACSITVSSTSICRFLIRLQFLCLFFFKGTFVERISQRSFQRAETNGRIAGRSRHEGSASPVPFDSAQGTLRLAGSIVAR
jgi:hypothetical protein